jgi:hypothetical protein
MFQPIIRYSWYTRSNKEMSPVDTIELPYPDIGSAGSLALLDVWRYMLCYIWDTTPSSVAASGKVPTA